MGFFENIKTSLALRFEKLAAEFHLNFIQGDRWKFLLQGLGTTMVITVLALLLGVALGIVIAMVRSTYDKTAASARPGLGRKILGFFNGFCKVYITVFQVMRKNLPGKKLRQNILPILAAPGSCKSATVLPKELWSERFVNQFWKG